MLEASDIKKLAQLSRIKLSASEEESLRAEMDSILTYVAEVQEVSLQTKGKRAPEHRNVFRDDAEPHGSGVYTERVLSAAPFRDGDHVKVKKIL